MFHTFLAGIIRVRDSSYHHNNGELYSVRFSRDSVTLSSGREATRTDKKADTIAALA